MLKFHQLRFKLEGLLQNKKYFRDSKQKSKRKNTQMNENATGSKKLGVSIYLVVQSCLTL